MTDLGLKSFDKLYPMLIHKYKDLIVDQNATEKDKINQIIVKLNALGKLSNDVVRDWNTVYQWVMNDGLTQDVNNKLEAMKANGEFDTLVSTVVALIGDLSTLETTAKDTVVHAVNEVDELAKSNQTKMGDLSTLTTADKDTLVHAINDNVVSVGQVSTNIGDLNTLQTADKDTIVHAINDNVSSLNKIMVIVAQPNGTNDTTAIQAAINQVFTAGGGTVKIPKGNFIATGLKIRTHVKLIGDGVATKIKNPANVTTDVISIYDDNTYGFSIENLQIDGNSGNGCTGNGIYLNRTNGATGEPTSETYEAGDGWFYLNKVDVYNCGQDGLYVGHNCREGRYHNLSIHENKRYGVFNEFGSDNHFVLVTSYANAHEGIMDKGSANHWTNCKAFGNGNSSRYSGWNIQSTDTTYTDVEAQENYGHGFEFNNASSVKLFATASSNGITSSTQNIASDITKYGFYLVNSNNVQVFGISDDFRKRLYGAQTQKASVYIDSASDMNTFLISEMFQSTSNTDNSIHSTIVTNGQKIMKTQYNGVETVQTLSGTSFAFTNNNAYPVQVVISGGTVSDISIAKQGSSGFSTTGLTQGCVYLAPTDNISITFSVAPSVKVFPL